MELKARVNRARDLTAHHLSNLILNWVATPKYRDDVADLVERGITSRYGIVSKSVHR